MICVVRCVYCYYQIFLTGFGMKMCISQPITAGSSFIKALQKDFGGYVMKSNTTGRKPKHCDAIKSSDWLRGVTLTVSSCIKNPSEVLSFWFPKAETQYIRSSIWKSPHYCILRWVACHLPTPCKAPSFLTRSLLLFLKPCCTALPEAQSKAWFARQENYRRGYHPRYNSSSNQPPWIATTYYMNFFGRRALWLLFDCTCCDFS